MVPVSPPGARRFFFWREHADSHDGDEETGRRRIGVATAALLLVALAALGAPKDTAAASDPGELRGAFTLTKPLN